MNLENSTLRSQTQKALYDSIYTKYQELAHSQEHKADLQLSVAEGGRNGVLA
jgi:hypothetical protein